MEYSRQDAEDKSEVWSVEGKISGKKSLRPFSTKTRNCVSKKWEKLSENNKSFTLILGTLE